MNLENATQPLNPKRSLWLHLKPVSLKKLPSKPCSQDYIQNQKNPPTDYLWAFRYSATHSHCKQTCTSFFPCNNNKIKIHLRFRHVSIFNRGGVLFPYFIITEKKKKKRHKGKQKNSINAPRKHRPWKNKNIPLIYYRRRRN